MYVRSKTREKKRRWGTVGARSIDPDALGRCRCFLRIDSDTEMAYVDDVPALLQYLHPRGALVSINQRAKEIDLNFGWPSN